ncbi:hypothetical protein DDB_G0288713 [Dictyostelium discoideum AX4]|uniref:Uncharacterized protein n=1 Tax=Dictyostelium discoideum TaxID=44689 RepID=Q54IJ5_DICDI|nr:hypothetical protein DDB_G0288713 [Dictyostelium discoideum AX4]EAL63088.1 hypothetical protein DDB_G0288713 [Dictyostelium discoideum AX4]|eukprot:XP_636591.1 hypothetical protein DDB_G0288713 [Dictyostelium discoideum AX4]
MGVGDNENPIVSFKFIVTSLLTKLIGRYFKEFGYTEFIYYSIFFFGQKIKYFQRDPDEKPSILKMILPLIFMILNVIFAVYYFNEDCKEIISKNNDPNLFIGLILLKYLFHNNNITHVMIHITDIYLNAIKFIEIIKLMIKEIILNYYAKMNKQLTKKPFENLDGAGGDDSGEDDYFEEIMCVNKGEKEEYYESRKLKQKIN